MACRGIVEGGTKRMNIIETNLQFKGNMEVRKTTNIIVLHHAAASTCDVRTIHEWHLRRGFSGIGYHFLVRKNGTIERGRAENFVGAHVAGHNRGSIGICFEGNFETETMGEAQKNAGAELVEYLKKKYSINTVVRHKDLAATACPGKNFPFEEILQGVKTETKQPEQVEQKKQEGDNKLVEDGYWGNGTTKRAQEVFGTPVDGVITGQFKPCAKYFPGIISISYGGNGSALVRAMQKWLCIPEDGYIGKQFVLTLQHKMGTIEDGVLSKPSDCIKAFQHWLNQQ